MVDSKRSRTVPEESPAYPKRTKTTRRDKDFPTTHAREGIPHGFFRDSVMLLDQVLAKESRMCVPKNTPRDEPIELLESTPVSEASVVVDETREKSAGNI